jgi:maleylacetate reductase
MIQAPRVLFGRGALHRVGEEAGTFGHRVLFVCTPSLMSSSHAGVVRASLGDLLVAEFNGVAPHVPSESVEAARALAIQHKVDVVVAMGGGSAIGVGKGVALPTPRMGDGQGGWVPKLIAIPTTYAGSEMTSVVGITDRAEGRKRLHRDPAALPKLAIYDPEVTLELPPELTATTAMNALAHCVEAVYARDANPVVVAVALEGIRRIVQSLPRCISEGGDIDAREELMLGAYLAAFGIANATMGLHHGLCHALGGRTGIPHGVANAIMLPHVMRFNADAVPAAMAEIAGALGNADKAPSATAALVASLPVPQRLHDAGVEWEALPIVARDAAASASVQANPRVASESDLLDILRAAW